MVELRGFYDINPPFFFVWGKVVKGKIFNLPLTISMTKLHQPSTHGLLKSI